MIVEIILSSFLITDIIKFEFLQQMALMSVKGIIFKFKGTVELSLSEFSILFSHTNWN